MVTDHPHERGDNGDDGTGTLEVETDHPHERGDNNHRPAYGLFGSGPPPRAWGQL